MSDFLMNLLCALAVLAACVITDPPQPHYKHHQETPRYERTR